MKVLNNCDYFFEILPRVRPVRIAEIRQWMMLAWTGQKDEKWMDKENFTWSRYDGKYETNPLIPVDDHFFWYMAGGIWFEI
jgi:hypothetical protein